MFPTIAAPRREKLEQIARSFRERDFAGADSLCRRLLADERPTDEVLVQLAQAAHQSGAAGQAIAFLHRAVDHVPDRAPLRLLLANLLQQNGKGDAALTHYEAVIRLDARSAEAHNNRGVLLAQRRQLQEAIGSFRRAVDARPDFSDAHNNLGNALRDAGRTAEAMTCFREALRYRPDYPEALNNLGIALALLERPLEAVDAYRAALALRPGYADAHNNLGNTLRRLGNRVEAFEAFRQAVACNPQFAVAQVNIGCLLAEQKLYDEAIAVFRQALAGRPGQPEAHYNLGNALLDLGRRDEAFSHYEQALRSRPDYAEARAALGKLRRERGESAQAVVDLQEAVRAKPGSPEILAQLGLALSDAGKYPEARDCLRQVLLVQPDAARFHSYLGRIHTRAGNAKEGAVSFQQALWRDPDLGEAHEGIGLTFLQMQRPDAALGHLRRATQLNPDSWELAKSLGNALRGVARYEEAIEFFRGALARRPNFPEAYNDVGIGLTENGQLEEALAAFEQALKLRPDYMDAAWNRALTNLGLGRLAEGWKEYEIRWKRPKANTRPKNMPEWRGEPLEGRTILLFAEQGLGDNIQFIRYARLVKERGGIVLYECPPPLKKLFDKVEGVDALVAKEQVESGAVSFDLQLPLLSAPFVFGTQLDDIPNRIPYLWADEKLVETWAARLADEGEVRIGVHWQGSPKFPGDRHRSCPLKHFAALARIPGVRLISIQKGLGRRQIAELREQFPVDDFGDEIDTASGSFMDTAGILKNVDLMVSADSATVHLAGALGVPTWMVLPSAADWRWLKDRDDNPWYPTMRLFRQSRPGDWTEVFDRVAAAVCARFPVDQPRRRPFVPADVNGLLKLGVECGEAGRPQAALGLFQLAVDRRPDLPEGHNNVGLTLARLGEWEAAAQRLLHALSLNPRFAEAENNLGNVLRETGKFVEAVARYQSALEHKPGYAEAHNNLGITLTKMGNLDEAGAHYAEAIRLKPDYHDAHWNQGLLSLLAGDLPRGFQGYERRFLTRPSAKRHAESPSWDGAPLEGKTLLLWAEQGLGDTLQFIRYAKLAKLRGARVLVECQSPLLRLLRRCPGIDQAVAQGTTLPKFEVHASLMSLPGIFGTEIANVPAEVPYVFAEPGAVQYWRQELKLLDGFKAAIAWQGNPNFPGDRHRSIPLAAFEPLAKLPGVRLLSLQKGQGSEQLYELADRFPVIDLSPQLDERNGPFVDTAAILQNVDLLICSDSAVAHLAGALGVETWLALSAAPDWRWLLGRSDSPWYPSMRLFRQKELGGWGDVFTAMAEALRRKRAAARATASLQAPVSAGELLDKITILELKSERIGNPEKLANVRRELGSLHAVAAERLGELRGEVGEEFRRLKAVNGELWRIEDEIRDCEAKQEFGAGFVELARSVYKQNDRRAALKRAINLRLDSVLVEEKSYTGTPSDDA